MPEQEPTRAYWVEEATKGSTTWLVYAHNGREARKAFHTDGVAIDSQTHPNGVSSVRRAPEEDRDA